MECYIDDQREGAFQKVKRLFALVFVAAEGAAYTPIDTDFVWKKNAGDINDRKDRGQLLSGKRYE